MIDGKPTRSAPARRKTYSSRASSSYSYIPGSASSIAARSPSPVIAIARRSRLSSSGSLIMRSWATRALRSAIRIGGPSVRSLTTSRWRKGASRSRGLRRR